MAFWNRLNQSKLKLLLSLQSGGTHCGSSFICFTKTLGSCLLENPMGFLTKSLLLLPTISVYCQVTRELFSTHGFQNSAEFSGGEWVMLMEESAMQKVEYTSRPILNDQIKFQYVRLVTDEGHSIITACQALEHAKRVNLDLVVVQCNVDPPVCKIMDYNKEKYKRKETEKTQSKSKLTLRKGECKEVRFSGKTEQKDLKMKADTISD